MSLQANELASVALNTRNGSVQASVLLIIHFAVAFIRLLRALSSYIRKIS